MLLNYSFKKLVVVSAVLFSTEYGLASMACKSLFSLDPKVAQLVIEDSFKQWTLWEQKSNFKPFRKSSSAIKIDMVKVNSQTTEVTLLKSAPESLKKLIIDGQDVNWFKHPYNTVSIIPHFNNYNTVGTVDVYFTASRSLALRINDDFFTLKMPTNYPHGLAGEYQPGKATVKEDITDGINRMEYIEKVDSQIGEDSQLILAKEVAMVADKATGEGYLFRDLSFMKDGNYYLPALSIPYAGRDIAKLNGESPEVFWKKHYAELLGKAKAKMLLRYGLQMETPNSQNMLIQLDRNLRPTGTIVFRDISDTMLVVQVAEGLGAMGTLKKDREKNVVNTTSIKPYWRNSSWRFDEAGKDSFLRQTLADWGKAHDTAYLKEIEKELEVNISNIKGVDNNRKLDEAMDSQYMKVKLAAYRSKLVKKHLEQKQAAQNNKAS